MHFAALGSPLAECCSYPVGFTSVPVSGTFRNRKCGDPRTQIGRLNHLQRLGSAEPSAALWYV